MFPGKGEYPDLSFTSPFLNSSVARKHGSSWLYSTLIVLWKREDRQVSAKATKAIVHQIMNFPLRDKFQCNRTQSYLSSPVSCLVSLATPPIACFAFLGIVKEFMMKPRFSETPSINGSVWKARPFVSFRILQVSRTICSTRCCH